MTVSGAVGVQCVFTSWSGATTGNGISSNSILMDNPKNVTANWKIQFQVSFASNPSAAGALSPSADTWTDAESSIPISATASSGYTFAFWSAPNGITITNPQASGTTASVTAPGTLTANFAVQSQSSSSSSQSSSSSSEASSSPSPSTPSQAQPKRGNLIIYVKDSGNNPVEGVTIVFASQPEGQVSLSATTNSSGYVTLCNVTAGSYSLQASKNGYIKNIVQTTAQTGKDTSAAIELQSETISPPAQPIEFGQIIAIVSAVAAFSVIGLFFIKRRKNK
jgi:cobalamin biosynthesis Mg chelatase CobN